MTVQCAEPTSRWWLVSQQWKLEHSPREAGRRLWLGTGFSGQEEDRAWCWDRSSCHTDALEQLGADAGIWDAGCGGRPERQRRDPRLLGCIRAASPQGQLPPPHTRPCPSMESPNRRPDLKYSRENDRAPEPLAGSNSRVPSLLSVDLVSPEIWWQSDMHFLVCGTSVAPGAEVKPALARLCRNAEKPACECFGHRQGGCGVQARTGGLKLRPSPAVTWGLWKAQNLE